MYREVDLPVRDTIITLLGTTMEKTDADSFLRDTCTVVILGNERKRVVPFSYTTVSKDF